MVSFLLIIALLLTALNTNFLTPLLSGDTEAIRSTSKGNISLLLLVTLVLMIIQNLFTIIPLILLISVNVTVFGFSEGYIWSWFTSIIGGMVSFLAARYWFQQFFTKWVRADYQQKLEKNGFMVVFIGRIFPFIPTSVVNIAAGLSSITWKPFVYGTLLGNMIYFFVLALIPLGIMSVNSKSYVYGGVIAAALGGVYTWRRFQKKRQSKKNKDAAL